MNHRHRDPNNFDCDHDYDHQCNLVGARHLVPLSGFRTLLHAVHTLHPIIFVLIMIILIGLIIRSLFLS